MHTRIWREEAALDNPFASDVAYCHGYDVYGEMVGHARWVEMLYLLFRGERPSASQADLLEALAVAMANPGPRDPSVHAAMCGGIGGSTAAASLIAALAVGAGSLGGGREVFLIMKGWETCGRDLDAWSTWISEPLDLPTDVWPEPEHPPGFDPHGVSTTRLVLTTVTKLSAFPGTPSIQWLGQHRIALEHAAGGLPLAFSGVVAAALHDLGFSAAQGEMLHLMLRLPGAAAHALEQWEQYDFRQFPWHPVRLDNVPKGRR
ncbi:MAG: citryl-CoA lyase [Burkholderiales bacterium]|nr:citryl-CoA lyase [Burkholderiales bacterium]